MEDPLALCSLMLHDDDVGALAEAGAEICTGHPRAERPVRESGVHRDVQFLGGHRVVIA